MRTRRGQVLWGGKWLIGLPALGLTLAATAVAQDGGGGRSAQAVWAELVPERYRERAAFDWAPPRQGKEKVFVYGDSISIGYTPYLRDALAEEADVYRLHTNGGHSGQVVEQADRLFEAMRQPGLEGGWDFAWDAIVFNVGLHDLKYVTEDGTYDVERGEQVHGLSEYQSNLEDAIAFFQNQCPEARLIFVMTTPVPEHSRGRVAGDAERYNAAAREVLSGHPDILICDLHAFSKPMQTRWWTQPGNVHYTEEGCRAQAGEVAMAVRQALFGRR